MNVEKGLLKMEYEDEFINKCDYTINELQWLIKNHIPYSEYEKENVIRLKGKLEGVKLMKDYYIEFKKRN